MNIIDKTIAWISPKTAFERERYRQALAAYDAAKPRTNGGRTKPDNSSPNLLTYKAGQHLRGYARQLEQNHDIANGVLTTMVNNIIGAQGISVEPMPRRKNGELHQEFAQQLLSYWQDFKKRPEVTWEHQWPQCERLMARAWIRDGEAFMQHLEGSIITLDHGTKVPYSVEMIEADYLPHWYFDTYNGIGQSIERNGWGRARNYYVLKQHPQDFISYGTTSMFGSTADMRRISADKMTHLKLVTRFRQARGVSIFATVMTRLEDIKDYEESERIAARVAAAMCATIVKGTPDDYTESDKKREFKISPGMIFDDLQPGEKVETIQSNRPSGLLGDFRHAMLRAVCAGTGVNFHSVAKDFTGTYVGLRLAFIDSDSAYSVLTNEFVSAVTQPVYERFVKIGILSGVISLPSDIDIATVANAEYFGPKMPSADPLKEGRANIESIAAGLKSPQQAIREAGRNPDATLEQLAQWQKDAEAKDLIFSTMTQGTDPALMDNSTTSG